MSRSLKLGWVQHTASSDVHVNLTKIESALAELNRSAPDVVVLTEAFAWLASDIQQQLPWVEPFGQGFLQEKCSHWAKTFGVYLVAGSLPLRFGDRVFATLCVFSPEGKLETFYRKQHLFSVETPEKSVFSEGCFFSAGSVPVIWSSPWGGIGLAICFDLRFPSLFQYYAKAGALLTILPAAFTKETGEAHWSVLVRARAIENQQFFLAVNQTGRHDASLHSYGHSLLVDPWGRVLVDSGSDTTHHCHQIDLALVSALRQKFPVVSLDSPLRLNEFSGL